MLKWRRSRITFRFELVWAWCYGKSRDDVKGRVHIITGWNEIPFSARTSSFYSRSQIFVWSGNYFKIWFKEFKSIPIPYLLPLLLGFVITVSYNLQARSSRSFSLSAKLFFRREWRETVTVWRWRNMWENMQPNTLTILIFRDYEDTALLFFLERGKVWLLWPGYDY